MKEDHGSLWEKGKQREWQSRNITSIEDTRKKLEEEHRVQVFRSRTRKGKSYARIKRRRCRGLLGGGGEARLVNGIIPSGRGRRKVGPKRAGKFINVEPHYVEKKRRTSRVPKNS